MKQAKQAAISFLARDYMLHVDMLEALRRGRGEVVFFEGSTVLLRRRDPAGHEGNYLLTSADPEEALRAFAGQPEPRCLVARGPGVAQRMEERFGLTFSRPCCNVAYLGGERPGWDLPGLTIRPYGLEELPAFVAHYDIEGEEEAREHIRRGELFAADYAGRLAGFIGLHSDGSMGLLEVFPEYRQLGIGRALERFLIGFCLDRGWVPYGQVFLDNEKSFSLQSHLGMTVDRTKALRWGLPTDEE